MLATRQLGTFQLAGGERGDGGEPVLEPDAISVQVGDVDAVELKPLTAYRGFTFDPVTALFTDDALTVPLPLTGWTVEVVIGQDGEPPAFTLTAGNGLIVARSAGKVQIVLTGYQTNSVTVDRLRWYLSLTDPAGFPLLPCRGQILFEDPL